LRHTGVSPGLRAKINCDVKNWGHHRNNCLAATSQHPSSPTRSPAPRLAAIETQGNCPMVLSSAPRNDRPNPLVKIKERDLGYELNGGDGAGNLDTAGYQETQYKCVDAAGGAPTDRLRERPAVRLFATGRLGTTPSDSFAGNGNGGHGFRLLQRTSMRRRSTLLSHDGDYPAKHSPDIRRGYPSSFARTRSISAFVYWTSSMGTGSTTSFRSCARK